MPRHSTGSRKKTARANAQSGGRPKKQGKPALHTCVRRTDCSGAAAKTAAEATEDPETATLEALVVLASVFFLSFRNSG